MNRKSSTRVTKERPHPMTAEQLPRVWVGGQGRVMDMVGMKVGRLTVNERIENSPEGKARWLCACECGGSVSIEGKYLRRGRTHHCGCLRGENSITHGSTIGRQLTSEYRCWKAIKNRCYNHAGPNFVLYGGRGICVCDRWLDSCEAFLTDMGKRPSSKHSIDRIDNDGNYEPSNCRWATGSEQARNRRSTRWIEVNGERLSAADWSRRLGGNTTLVHRRLHLGWTEEDAVLTPVGRRRMEKKP